MQVDIGVLLGMDTLDRNMIPAPHSDSDAMDASTNSITPLTCSDMNARAHLHPTTNTDHDRDYGGWDRTAYQNGVKHWPSVDGESASCEYSCSKTIPSKYHSPPQVLLEQYLDTAKSPIETVPLPSFSAVSSDPTYDTLEGLHLNPDLSSPIQSREEAQWQMYLTASLSNPLDSLAFHPHSSTPALPYSSDAPDTNMLPAETLPSADLFTLPDGPTFATQTLVSSTHYRNPFVDNQTQPPADTSAPRAPFDFNHYTSINGYHENPSEYVSAATERIHNGGYPSLTGISSNSSYNSAPISLSGITSQAGVIIPPVPSPKPTPHPGRFPALVHPSPVRVRRGLSGWSGTLSPDLISGRVFSTNMHKKRLRSISPTVPFGRPPTVETLSSTGSNQESLARDIKRIRQRQPIVKRTAAVQSAALSDMREFELDSDDDFGEDEADSEDYRPSRSPSVIPDNALQFRCETGIDPLTSSKKKPRRSKGKAKGSAALALAVVSQLGASRSQTGSENFDDDFDPLVIYREGRHGIRKRKNHPIPLPVPIPNLNKKSRGRKVPFVTEVPSRARSASPTDASKGELGSDENRGGVSRNTSRARRKSARMPTPVTDELAGSRSYICVVPGCGKCFVRGEHLKRHVRSIHTHDKPHPCPFEGCDKSFSRRDNLGQHVRIHLQP